MRSRYRRPSRRAAVIATTLLIVAAVAIVLATSDEGGGSGDSVTTTTNPVDQPLKRSGSEEVRTDSAFAMGTSLDGYRITYRVTQRGVGHRTTEVLTARRPFTSELLSKDERGAVVDVQRWAFGRVKTVTGKETPQVFAVGPTIGGYDFHPSISVDEAAARGLLDRREQRKVVGRRCQVYRTATALTGGVLTALDATSKEYADVCFDEQGLLLEEWWVVDGSAIRQRVATEVKETAPDDFGAGWSEEPTTASVGDGGGSVLRLRAGSAPPGPYFEASSVPPGFTHVGRYSVVPPQPITVEGADRTSAIASTADVWQRGSDVLILDQGGSLGGRQAYPPDPTNRSIDLGGLGTAEVVLGLGTNEVRIVVGRGRYARVIGTLSTGALVDVARSLVQKQGNELVVEEGPLLPS